MVPSTDRPVPRRRPARDCGSAVAETVVIVPALMILLLAGMQLALYALASHAADLAVQQGGAMARSALGGPKAGRRLALADVHAIASGLLQHPRLTTRAGSGGMVTVELTATVPSILPGLRLSVEATSVGPSQQFRPG